ncbi:MAG: hypothetical protein JW840_02545 [Candidatus Thermoplasmatota archaeon]|nr:hypothetical protein [Candidatus Thermoplasmatota archaeon]
MAMAIPFDLNVTDVLPGAGATLGSENAWMLYVLAALVFGIILGGTMRGLAKLVLGLVLVAGFAVIALIALQRHDLLSTIASIVFGVIILLFSFLVKVGKSYAYVKK